MDRRNCLTDCSMYSVSDAFLQISWINIEMKNKDDWPISSTGIPELSGCKTPLFSVRLGAYSRASAN